MRTFPTRNHPARRVAVVLLAVAVVGATTVGAWLGGGSGTTGPASAGPPLGELETQVEQVWWVPVPTSSASPASLGSICGPVDHLDAGHTRSSARSMHRRNGRSASMTGPSNRHLRRRVAVEWDLVPDTAPLDLRHSTTE